jgi:hypothetical protein
LWHTFVRRFFPVTAKDLEQKDEQLLEREIDEFHSKMVHLLEKANAQKATIGQLRARIEQQAKEVNKRFKFAPKHYARRRIYVLKPINPMHFYISNSFR